MSAARIRERGAGGSLKALEAAPVLIASLSFVVLFLSRRQGIRWSHEDQAGLAFQWGVGLLAAAAFHLMAVLLIPKRLSFRKRLACTLTGAFCASVCVFAWQVLERCRYGYLLDKDGLVCLGRAGGGALLLVPLAWFFWGKGRLRKGLHLFFAGIACLVLAGLILSLSLGEWKIRAKLRKLPAGERPKHIIIYLSDTTRWDALGSSGYRDASTPRLDWLAEQSVVFERAYANSPWTPPAHASLFTGLLPIDHGMLSEVWLAEEVLTLQEKLSREGYLTIGFAQNPFVSRETNLAQGFLRFHEVSYYCDRWDSEVEQLLMRVTRELKGGPKGDVCDGCMDISRRALEVLDRFGDKYPLFLFINVMPPHTPYQLTEVGRNRACRHLSEEAVLELQGFHDMKEEAKEYMLRGDGLTEAELRAIRGLYEGEVAQVDRAVGELLDGLQATGFWSDTLFVFTSDHGEEFGEHQLLGHGRRAYDTLLRVPLLVRCPWIPALTGPSRRDGLAQLADLPATICRAVGLSWPEEAPFVGLDLAGCLTSEEPREIEGQYDRLPQFGAHDPGSQGKDDRLVWRIGRETKVILGDNGLREHFNLLEDPLEKANEADKEDPLLNALQASRGGDWLNAPRAAPSRSLNRNAAERLRALGYLGG